MTEYKENEQRTGIFMKSNCREVKKCGGREAESIYMILAYALPRLTY